MIIDTPPIGSVIDAAVIAKQCDGSIFLIASDTVSRGEAKGMVQQLRAANENILGAVLTKANVGRGKYYYSKYSHYYTYSGYGAYSAYGAKQNEKVGQR